MKRAASLSAVFLTMLAPGAFEPLEARAANGEAAWAGPLLVSPGKAGREGRVGTGCPTFSWALVLEATGYEVTVYEADGGGGQAQDREPVLRMAFPAGVTSWTPDLGECLPPGRYGWTVAAIVETMQAGEERRWAKPAIFRVEDMAATGRNPERTAAPAGARGRGAVAAAPGSAPDDSPLRAMPGEGLFTPPGCSGGGEMFTDVPASSLFCPWIEQLARDGITSGCGGGKYCPTEPVTRQQLAMFLERAMRGTLHWAPGPGGPRVTTVDDDPTDILGQHASIAVGNDDLPIISYYDDTANVLMAMHCNDVACTGGDETISVVDDPVDGDDVGQYSSIAIGANGFPVISYFNVTDGDVNVALCNDAACSGGDETIRRFSEAGYVGHNTSIAIGADGFPIVSYYSPGITGRLAVAHCGNATCDNLGVTLTQINDPDGNNVGQFGSIAIGTDQLPVISYWDQDATALKVAHCDDQACAGQNETVTTVDDPASTNVGGYTSLAIGTDGYPVISYYDSTAGVLKVAHCNDAACAPGGETITAVDDPSSGNSVGTYTSIAVGGDGLPVISYRDVTAKALKVAHCNDVACAGSNETITTVDDPFPNEVGEYTSLAIGADGVPVIAYRDSTAQALKVVHCGTVTCAQ